MKLYHFTSPLHIEDVRREGITLGAVPMFDGNLRLVPGHQWLTVDPRFDQQHWATRNVVKYDRAAHRITVKIPRSAGGLLTPWAIFAEFLVKHGAERQFIQELNSVGGSEHWYIYSGGIRPGWLREVVSKPAELQVSA